MPMISNMLRRMVLNVDSKDYYRMLKELGLSEYQIKDSEILLRKKNKK